MPKISAFRGLRYDLGHVGNLSDVVAPPYDVIGPELQDLLYKRHPANVIRLILNRDEPGDTPENNRYTRAARFLRNWQQEGVLTDDPQAALYVYHQQFDYEGTSYLRRGFMGRVGLQKFGEGNIYPHEETISAAKEDRFRLTVACRANLSQIFGLFPDGENQVQNAFASAIHGVPPVEATDHLGVTHRMWPVTDLATIQTVASIMHAKPIYIADGHHRYETALNYREHLANQGELRPDDPAHNVLMMCVSMSDPGMIVLPTHRLFRGAPNWTSEELETKISSCFDLTRAGQGVGLAETIWQQIEDQQEQGTLALYTARDQKWLIARINADGRQRMDAISQDHSEDWRELGVAVLHRLLVENILGLRELPKPTYVHLVSELVSEIESDAGGSEYPLAALVMPATLDHVRSISEHGERMPAKSTYFYPKLLSGLVINRLA
ncbi:MAG: DUF1015 domain-containing protein [Planctomycetota bacterium]|nr:DUF1015 domain-containing protein [Planctomycetota bacterium]